MKTLRSEGVVHVLTNDPSSKRTRSMCGLAFRWPGMPPDARPRPFLIRADDVPTCLACAAHAGPIPMTYTLTDYWP